MILPNTSDKAVFGVGIDTARYGHHVSFLRAPIASRPPSR